MKHVGSLDVRKDLRVRGIYQDTVRVAEKVVAPAFYLRGGANLSQNQSNIAEFQIGQSVFLRIGSLNEIETGAGGGSSGVIFADTSSGSLRNIFQIFAGAGNIQPEIAGTRNFHIYEPTGSNVNRMLIMGPGLLTNTDVNLGIPVQNQLVLHRDGKVALGYEDLDYNSYQYHLNINGPTLTFGGFYVTDTIHSDQTSANIVAELSDKGLFLADKGHFDKRGLVVNNRVKAEAFYLESGGEFSSEAVTLPTIGNNVANSVYVGDDGILYVYDTTRNKNLSVHRQTYGFVRASATNDVWLGFSGLVPSSSTQAQVAFHRPMTITGLVGTAASVATAEAAIQLRTSADSFGSRVVGLDFYVNANPTIERKTLLNIDLNKDQTIAFLTSSPGGATVSHLKVLLELASRDDG